MRGTPLGKDPKTRYIYGKGDKDCGWSMIVARGMIGCLGPIDRKTDRGIAFVRSVPAHDCQCSESKPVKKMLHAYSFARFQVLKRGNWGITRIRGVERRKTAFGAGTI